MNKLSYRPEIDGLRAVAVMAVILFHVGFGFSGGYVGVDVFFVISGFLITGLILKAQDNNEFRLREFWLRRIRRLAPALVVLQSVVLALGLWMLLPHELKMLADSSIAQVCMVSNYYFADELDYFAGPAELMPLLHTWSLAVEEQFYLLLPVLLVLCRRLSRKWLFTVLGMLAIASFVYSAWGVYEYPQHTFFLLSTRAWELLLGSLLAFAPPLNRSLQPLRNTLSCAGMAGILISCFWFDEMTPFPGAAALLPCVSTALIIYATGGGQTWIGRMLATRPFVGVGQISYSLYLWHWPVIVFLKYKFGLHLSPVLVVAAVALSFLLGYLSWKYAETPFRRGQFLTSRRHLVSAAMACALVIVCISSACSLSDGLPGRFNDSVLALLDNNSNKQILTHHAEEIANDQLPMLGATESDVPIQPSVLVWGDSHALRAFYPCDELAKQYGVTGYVACRGATVPLVDTWRRGYGRRRGPNGDAVRWNREVIELVKRKKISHVILVARWEYYIEPLPSGNVHDSMIKDASSMEHTPHDSRLVMRRGLQRTIDALHDAGAKVWVMKQVPLQQNDPIRQMVDAALRGETTPPRGIELADHQERQRNANEILEKVVGSYARALDPAMTCFDEQGRSIIGTADRSYYFDDDHLSPLGAKVLLRPVLEPVFEDILREKRLARARTADEKDSRFR